MKKIIIRFIRVLSFIICFVDLIYITISRYSSVWIDKTETRFIVEHIPHYIVFCVCINIWGICIEKEL